jgi:hypothetical protein
VAGDPKYRARRDSAHPTEWRKSLSLFQIERPDWTLFTSLATLSQKAGVPVRHLRRLALKELVDNALDAGGNASIRATDRGYIIEDDGPGIGGTPEEIARLFSIDRPLISEKLWRRPSRGALGNGLRVVAGALIGSAGGRLVVTTRNKRLRITPLEQGGAAVDAAEYNHPVGTKIEIEFGPLLREDVAAMSWASLAIAMAQGGKEYAGKPSVWHHDADSFHTLAVGAGSRLVRDFISAFDGCSGAKAGEIASRYLGRACESLSRGESADLLVSAREKTDPISHRRLGAIGLIDRLPNCYAKVEGEAEIGTRLPKAIIPVVVEVWAAKAENSTLTLFVNRTPVTAEIEVMHTRTKQFAIFGCGLRHKIEAPKKGEWRIFLNLITPHMPITSDGKTPDLEIFVQPIVECVEKAIRKTRGYSGAEGKPPSQKAIFLENLDEGVRLASDNGRFRPSVRDLFYAMRPFFLPILERDPEYKTFETMVADHERDEGEIEGLYREERGAIYHPHTGDETQLGTLEVETYERPAWLYSSIVIIEKMGLIEAIKTVGLHDRLDFAPMTSRGYTTRAVKDLLDSLSNHDEPLKVFCVVDADAPGGLIYETLVKETRARGARKVDVVFIGLAPWEAEEMGLVHEALDEPKRRRPVADFIREHEPRVDGQTWEEWLQRSRYELNALGIPRFLKWLEEKLLAHGARKVVPPQDVIKEEARAKVEAELRRKITERILQEAGFEDQVTAAMAATRLPEGLIAPKAIGAWLTTNCQANWRDCLDSIIAETAENRAV